MLSNAWGLVLLVNEKLKPAIERHVCNLKPLGQHSTGLRSKADVQTDHCTNVVSGDAEVAMLGGQELQRRLWLWLVVLKSESAGRQAVGGARRGQASRLQGANLLQHHQSRVCSWYKFILPDVTE